MLTPAHLSTNHILASLSESDAQRLLPQFDTVELAMGDVLYQRGENPEYVHFPLDCLVAKLHVMQDGTAIEAAVIGNDGMAGMTVFTGGEDLQGAAVVHAAGNAIRMRGRVLRDECRRYRRLHDSLLQYTQALLTQMAQSELCNRFHTVEQQLCRWLLLSLDRAPRNPLVTAHYPLGTVSGPRRESAANVAAKLQRNGAIRYHWGYLEVIDRNKLEELVCSCYEALNSKTTPQKATALRTKVTSH